MTWNYIKHSGNEYEHISIAERALGKKLPSGVVVHHVNGDGCDNRPNNLVILQSKAEHNTLHRRARAFDATGNADSLKCVYCKEWDQPENMYVRQRPRSGIEARHRACHAHANRRSA